MQSFPNIPALRSHLENQVGFLSELTQKSLETLRSVSHANLRLSQQLLQDSVDTSRALLNCATPLEFSPAALRQAGPVSQHLRDYQQAMVQLLTGTLPDPTRAAGHKAESDDAVDTQH